jgi:penicillin amidase
MTRSAEPTVCPVDVTAFDLVTPGEIGFIAPDGTRPPHYGDQLARRTDLGCKPLWREDRDAARHARQITKMQLLRRPASPRAPQARCF